MSLWRWLIAFLTWLSADPQAVDLEHPKAAAAVSAARASMLVDTAPTPPAPAPQACDCGSRCVRGVWKPDGKIEQICRCCCSRCQQSRKDGGIAARCDSGNCSPSSSAGR